MASANAPVVQLDRIPDYESGGRRFESFRVRHIIYKSLLDSFSFPYIIRSKTVDLYLDEIAGYPMSLRDLLSKPVRRADINPIIREVIAAILSSCKPKSVFLFGSAARDQMTDSSDLGLLVVVADGSDFKGIKLKYYCRRKTAS